MTSHALTPEQEAAIHHACLDLLDLPHYSDSRHEDSLSILSNLARTLLEPVEKERDELGQLKQIAMPIIDMQASTILRHASELAEAREENTRLREQSDALKADEWLERATTAIVAHTGTDCGHRLYEQAHVMQLLHDHRLAALEPRPPLRDEEKGTV